MGAGQGTVRAGQGTVRAGQGTVGAGQGTVGAGQGTVRAGQGTLDGWGTMASVFKVMLCPGPQESLFHIGLSFSMGQYSSSSV